MVGLNESLQNVTVALNQVAIPTIQQKLGTAPAWLQMIGGTVHNVISSILPGREWLGVLIIAGVLAGLVVKKLREGVISLTALWAGGTIVIYLALKYAGL